jgi:hypothetical protein
MAPFSLCLLEHRPLLSSTDGSLHLDSGAESDLPRLDTNLLSQFTRRRDDDRPDITRTRSARPPVKLRTICQRRIGCDNSLDDGNQETERLAGTSLSLRNPATVNIRLV